ncbi:MAG TPA: SRPBCC domain-containing protein [Actinospica sp.]|nr:SRPBCC domain-containing protein [Actinospica sp.]
MREGKIERDGGEVLFRFEYDLAHPVQRVWTAITEPAEVERWLGSRPEIDLRPGGEYVSYHGEGAMRVVDEVLRVEPPRIFEHTFWRHVNRDGRVSWELKAVGTESLLLFTHRLSEADIENAIATVAVGADADLVISRNAAGWQRLLDRLQQSLGVED